LGKPPLGVGRASAYRAPLRKRVSAAKPEPTTIRVAARVTPKTSGGPPVPGSGLALALDIALALELDMALELAVDMAVW